MYETGQHSNLEIFLMSQWIWKISKPISYGSLMLSAHKAPITSKMQLRTASRIMLGNEKWMIHKKDEMESHKCSLSLARQCNSSGKAVIGAWMHMDMIFVL